jgi:hypothetical protein
VAAALASSPCARAGHRGSLTATAGGMIAVPWAHLGGVVQARLHVEVEHRHSARSERGRQARAVGLATQAVATPAVVDPDLPSTAAAHIPLLAFNSPMRPQISHTAARDEARAYTPSMQIGGVSFKILARIYRLRI